MTSDVAVLLGIASARPVMGVFFATSARTHLRPDQFFGIAFWTGFAINSVVIELSLHSKRRAQLQNLEQISGTSRLTLVPLRWTPYLASTSGLAAVPVSALRF